MMLMMIKMLYKKIRLKVQYLRFGEITCRVVGTAGDNVTAEIEYYDRNGKMIGLWAYGEFHPRYPYKG